MGITHRVQAYGEPVLRVRRMHQRDRNRAWAFLERCFHTVNRETVVHQRPRSKRRFLEVYFR